MNVDITSRVKHEQVEYAIFSGALGRTTRRLRNKLTLLFAFVYCTIALAEWFILSSSSWIRESQHCRLMGYLICDNGYSQIMAMDDIIVQAWRQRKYCL